MLRLASDADVKGAIVSGLRLRLPEIDVVRVQDALPIGTSDVAILAWAAAENRVLISNDRATMIGFAYERIAANEPMPGLVVTSQSLPIGVTIDHLTVIVECGSEAELRNMAVIFLPL